MPTSASIEDIENIEKIFLDVCDLSAPEPFEIVLQQVLQLAQGKYIHMRHRKKPLPLLQLITENNFSSYAIEQADSLWDIFIWRTSDERVNHYCLNHYSLNDFKD